MVSVKAQVETNIQIKPRLNVLYMVIYELADKFGASDVALDTIEKGVLNKQYLKEIILRYYNVQNEIVGEVVFTIDWEKFQINAADEKGAEFKIDCNRSTYSQISKASEQLIKYVNKMKKDLQVKKIDTWYRTIVSKTENEELYNTIHEYLGLGNGTESASYNLSPQFAHNIEMIFGALTELTVAIKRI